MSQDKRHQWEAITAAGDAGNFGPIAHLIHRELEFRSMFSVADGQGVYTGIEGLSMWAEDVHTTWEDFVSRVVDFREAGGEQAVAFHRLTGRARASGVPLDARAAVVLTWRHDKLWRVRSYMDPHEALDAAGLTE